MTTAEMIKKALLRDVDLTEEEFAEKNKIADATTAKHGYKGKASVNETRRARRMSMNFYGTALNILVNLHATTLEMLAEQKKTNRLLEAIIGAETEPVNTDDKGADNG